MRNLGRTMLRAASVAVIGLVAAHAANAAEMTGAGSTFAYPILAKWAESYKAATGSSLNYQSIGSGGGINQIEAKTVDFGATDKPLSAADLQKNGLTQFPFIMGGVVVLVNLPGIEKGQLTLDGATLANMYLGKITKWDDVAIAKLNFDSREVLQLRLIQELSYEEIAAVLEIPVGTVRSRLHKAVKTLQQSMNPGGRNKKEYNYES